MQRISCEKASDESSELEPDRLQVGLLWLWKGYFLSESAAISELIGKRYLCVHPARRQHSLLQGQHTTSRPHN